MKNQHRELLSYLHKKKQPQTSSALATALKFSSRSVKNYVSEINNLYNKKIILSSRNGYELNPQVSSNLIINQTADSLPQTNEERSFYIIKQLILKHTPHLELFDLCDYFCISYSTLKSLISKMNKTFSSYDIKFICENNFLHIIGNEISKRKLISYVICEESKASYIDLNQIKEFFYMIDVVKLNHIILSTFSKQNYYLNDFAAINLLLHLAIIIDRELNGNKLDVNESYFTIKDIEEKRVINDLITALEVEFKIKLNKYEHFEIFMLFKANVNYSLPTTKEELKKVVGKDILDLTTFYVKQVNHIYMIDLSDDIFTTPFSLHLKNLLFRAKVKKYTTNPMAETIKMNSPIVFDIAIYIGLDLMDRYQISLNEDEMAFLALHIGAEIERQNQNKTKIRAVLLCPTYRNLSSNLLNQLLLTFDSQLTIVRSITTIEEAKSLDFSLLLSTIPISKKYPFDILQISPFNLNIQYDLIQEKLLSLQDRYKNQKLRSNFHSFFEKDLFFANPNVSNKEEVISLLSTRLKEKKYVSSGFEKKVLKREYAATTAFGSIAIPHSMDMDAIKTSIAVITSKKGLSWDNNCVHLILLLAINKADKKTFRELYESLISIFNDKSIIQEIKDCDSFKDFEMLIYNGIENSE